MDPDPDTAEPNEEVSPNSTNDNHDTSRDSIHFETISDSEIDEEELDYILRNKKELEYYESKENSLLLLSHDILFDSDHFVDKDGSYNVELYLTEERDKIRSRIVDSPQHIIADIENLRRKRSELRNDLELLGQNIGDVKAKNSQMNSLLGILADKRKNMKEAQVLCKTISELELKLKEETSKLDSLDRAHKEMEKRLLNVQKKQKVAEQQEREVCDQNEEAIRNLKLTLDEKKGTLASQTKCTEESSIAYKELEAELEAVTVEFNTVRETCTQVMQVLYDNYQQMLQQRENFAHSYLNQ
ncbi:centriolin-like [Diaphorina citri]|uniref:Centriolin-like n=1 Tax=Diaphorina citri TaxID=121845 RepID=A0A1S3DF91_DIACI|nr:centriolin-like [Diaphorina citri]